MTDPPSPPPPTTSTLPPGLTGPGGLWVVDLDGVVWLAGTPIGPVGASIDALRAAGARVVFATNNSAPTPTELVERLHRAGVGATEADVVSSAHAAASLVAPGSTALVLGEEGVRRALADRGVELRTEGPVDAVVVGWCRTFDFDILATVSDAVRRGAVLIGTNEDPVHPTPGGLVPGTGALLAAVATASRVRPVVAGKPHDALVALIRARFGVGTTGGPTLVVGDQPSTDGRLAARLGVPFALVDSGVTAPGTEVDDVAVAVRAPDLVTLVDRLLGGPDVH